MSDKVRQLGSATAREPLRRAREQAADQGIAFSAYLRALIKRDLSEHRGEQR
jgi:hypothetical protein